MVAARDERSRATQARRASIPKRQFMEVMNLYAAVSAGKAKLDKVLAEKPDLERYLPMIQKSRAFALSGDAALQRDVARILNTKETDAAIRKYGLRPLMERCSSPVEFLLRAVNAMEGGDDERGVPSFTRATREAAATEIFGIHPVEAKHLYQDLADGLMQDRASFASTRASLPATLEAEAQKEAYEAALTPGEREERKARESERAAKEYAAKQLERNPKYRDGYARHDDMPRLKAESGVSPVDGDERKGDRGDVAAAPEDPGGVGDARRDVPGSA